MTKAISFSKKNILDKDLKIVNEILKSGLLTNGKYTDKFEKKFSEYTNSQYIDWYLKFFENFKKQKVV